LPHEQLLSLFESSRAFVQHSLQSADGVCEGTPVAILEAAAAAMPVISTDHAGISQAVIHEETGFLVEETDLSAMVRFMKALLSDPKRSRRLGKRARIHARSNYDIKRHLSRLNQILATTVHQ
jgi:glycosyltransferase involved in cell wall biosynthesis